MLSTQCELMEQEAAEGQPLNAHVYGTITSHLTRTLSVLGLKREPVDVTPALHQYLDTLPTEPQDSRRSRGRERGLTGLHAFSAVHQGYTHRRRTPVSPRTFIMG